ncbi:YcaO-like family protein [Streptomyces bottropensis]|uniref:YcaO-like family protein n=1 Tax=Streptomyces bottropensis TaxID=42235 RepID=UPI00367EBD71
MLVDLVRRRRAQRPTWAPDLLRATSTGLACGNTRDEALLHALAGRWPGWGTRWPGPGSPRRPRLPPQGGAGTARRCPQCASWSGRACGRAGPPLTTAGGPGRR